MRTQKYLREPMIGTWSVHIVFVIAICSMCLTPARGQANPARVDRSLAPQSRAELEAEQTVALSADKIIELLRQETGLLLQVKRVLVRKAYEQGRVLEPEDLTDDALFQLLREDHNVCVLATREIENRFYVRVKPTKQEMEAQRGLPARLGPSTEVKSPNAAENGQRKTASQEEEYWQRQEDIERYTLPPAKPNLNTIPSPPAAPQTTPNSDNPARQLEMTDVPKNQDFYEGMGIEGGSLNSTAMSRITPDQLPALLSATSSPSETSMSTLDGSTPAQGRTDMGQSFAGNLDAQSFGGSLQSDQRQDSDSVGLNDLNLQASLAQPRKKLPSRQDLNLDRPQMRRRPNPYANVPSLYELYSQVSQRTPALEQFGVNIFRNGTGNLDRLPIDLPAGPDYVLGPGDGLSIDVWGGVARRLLRTVDRSGRVALPEVGTIEVAGRTLGDVQRVVQAALRTQFREVEADVSLSRIRSIRVYVVGEVENPGPYDISSLSTPLNALYAAGGPTSRGSLRHLRVLRGKELIQEVDAYDLLLHGVHNEVARIQSGDTIQVPAVGREVTIAGMVMHPAIYELDQESSLAEALELAGGVLPSGTYRHIEVERVIAH
ncbi:MAG: polysaccharide export protein, partial [Acidobacteria bacterium]|nr:polysaccharide export protein [Acidobacteriota bacterium]